MRIMLVILLLFIMPGSGHGKCSGTNTSFQKNKGILIDLLIKNTPLHDGFYNSSVGNNSDQVYGVSQCKANISSNVCAHCLKISLGPSERCADSTEMESMSSFCTTRISNKNIFGVWVNSTTTTYGNEGLDDPLVFSKGFSMMQDLANTVPYQPLMFQASEIDVGVDGKRHGLAQCGRDLSKVNCKNCLEDLLLGYRSYILNRTGWEIIGSSCMMWYYKNLEVNMGGVSPSAMPSDNQYRGGPVSVASKTQNWRGGIRIGTSILTSTFTILLLATQVFHLS